MAAGLAVARPPDAVAKAVISTTCRVKRNGRACIARVPTVDAAACKAVLGLAFTTFCRVAEVAVSETGFPKMGMGPTGGRFTARRRLAGLRLSPSHETLSAAKGREEET